MGLRCAELVRKLEKTMDRVADLEAEASRLNLHLSSSSLDSDSASDTFFLGLNPLDDSKLREIEELRVTEALLIT